MATLAWRRGRWLGDDLTAMALVTSLIEQADRFLPQFVHDARANDHTWHEIAYPLGNSPRRRPTPLRPRITVADNR